MVDSRSRQAWPAAQQQRTVHALFNIRDALAGRPPSAAAPEELEDRFRALGWQRDAVSCGLWSVMCAYACVSGLEPGSQWKPGVIKQEAMNSQRLLLAASAVCGRLVFRYRLIRSDDR